MRRWLAGLITVFATSAFAQLNPGTPVRIVIGYPPGGSADFTARHLAEAMARELGTPVIVDNRPGAGTMIASDAVAKARADGHTLLLNWHQVIVKALLKEALPYDPERDLVPVTRVATGANVLVVNNSVPARNLAEFIAWMKANPGRINAASGGHGSAPHIAMAAFELAVGAKFNTIQYKGGGPAVQSILAGDTQVLFASAPSVMSLVKAGKLRPLVVTTRQASPSIAGVPGSVEAGLPDYESTFWFGLFAPAGTPPATLARLQQATAAALARPEVRARIEAGGMDATPSPSQAAFATEVAAEGPKLERLMQALGAKVD